MSAASILAGFIWGGAVLVGPGDVVPVGGIDGAPAAPMVLAGEIVISSHPKASDPAATTEKDASRQMESAREHRTGQTSSTTPTVIVVPEDDEGMLSPRRSGSGAAEHSSRARTYRQIDSSSGAVMPPLSVPDASMPGVKMENASQRARDNRNRATEYRTGETRIGNQVAVVGKDGLPIIDCSATENAAGRIGDDTRSGSVIILIQDRNQIRVRCR